MRRFAGAAIELTESLPVLLFVVGAVLAGADRAPPVLVVAVPGDGFLQSLGEVDLGLPAQLLLELGGGERGATIVAGAFLYVLDKRILLACQLNWPLDHFDAL